MNKIHFLDNNTINKIAAGEVVERPSSVVKELVENSIDANATAITIEIKEGGTSLIKISDNGSGIEKGQVETAFIRHATSKIEKIDDLDDVYTMGFRGEALASIASVSQVEMITKTIDQEEGYKIEISGGNVVETADCAAKVGTIITIKNIFYNVPARRKFLKKPATESSYIADIVNKLALAHPEISIKYINNGNIMLHTSGNNDLQMAIYGVYGKDVSTKMIEVDYTEGDFTITGMIGKPELARGNRNYENLF
ncbi:MAG: DNA mismatch repair endonuclease MutL, partial [Anaerotignaceae bacterium]